MTTLLTCLQRGNIKRIKKYRRKFSDTLSLNLKKKLRKSPTDNDQHDFYKIFGIL